MTRRTLIIVAVAMAAGCGRTVEIEKTLKLVDVETGWYDAGLVNGSQNKLVPSISFKLTNSDAQPVTGVLLNAIFRRVGEVEVWGEHFVSAIGPDGLPATATSRLIVMRSNLGYTGTEPRTQILKNSRFVDARVEVFGKQGRRNWVKLGAFPIDRQLLTE
jgi:hypothetical protein